MVQTSTVTPANNTEATIAENLEGVRILFYAECDFSSRKREYKEALALIAAGADVRFVGFGDRVPDFLAESAIPVSLLRRVDALIQPLGWMGPLAEPVAKLRREWWRSVKRPVDLAGAVAPWVPQVVHAVDTPALAVATVLAHNYRAKLVYDSHEYWRGFRSNPALRDSADWTKRVLIEEARNIGRADLVLTTSPEMSEALGRDYGDLPTLALYNAPPLAYRTVAEPCHDPMRFVYHGNIGADRNVSGLLEALAAAGGTPTLAIYGGFHPGFEEQIRSDIERLHLDDRVTVHGPFDYRALEATLRDYDVEVYAGLEVDGNVNVTLPNKLFDAIVNGLAVAMPPFAPMERIVAETGAGVILDTSSVDALTRSLVALRHDPGAVSAMKERAVAAAPSLAWEAQAEKLVGAYAALVGKEG